MADIVVDNFQKGVAVSPFVGFGSMVGMDIFRKPGVIQNAPALVQQGTVTLGDNVTAQGIDSHGNIYLGTADGNIYKQAAGSPTGTYTVIGTTTSGTPVHDFAFVQDYLIISKGSATLDLYGPLSSGSAYIPDWKTGLNLSVNGYKKMVVGQDNVLYIANEGALASQTGLYPTLSTTPSAIASASCLSTGLPTNRVATTICEMNRYIVIVTCFGNAQSGKTRIYFMDRGTLDPSKTSFSLSIGVDIPERRINQLINQNNKLIMFGPDTGTFYTTNSTNYSIITTLPGRQINQTYNTLPNAVALLNNEILFGIGLNTLYQSTSQVGQGIFSLQGNSVITKAIASVGSPNLLPIVFGSILVTGTDIWQTGYKNNSLTSILDSTTSNNYLAESSKCWFESPMYDTGTYLIPRIFQNIQFNLANNLVSGQTITVSYRTAINEAYGVYAPAKSFSFTTYGTVNSFKSPFPTIPTTNIQLFVTLDSGVNGLPGNEVQLQSIILS